ncbi:MAG: PilZ domain-containing protein [Halopseudomonas aestusnigri]
MENSTERRQFPRYRHDLKALINLDETWDTAECRDISGSGIRFTTTLRPTLKKTIQIHINDLGRFEGIVLRHVDDGFVVQLNASEFIMRQLADQLACELVDK